MTTDTGVAPLFQQVVAGYKAGQHAAKNYNVCPDQHVGDVDGSGYLGDIEVSDFAFRHPPCQLGSNRAPVVLILESPHTREFADTNDIGPAKGSTGRQLRRHVARAFAPLSLSNSARRPLILMNAIQHQCSLGAPTKLHRDAVFSLMWTQAEVQASFVRRLRRYASTDGALVVNACTAGKFKDEAEFLWRRVESVIVQAICRPSDLSVPHPYRWFSSVTRTGLKKDGGIASQILR